MKRRNALISVSDKTGLIPLARALERHDIQIYSTGGTLKALKNAGLKVLAVEDLTGFPEMMDGRVKTLHPKVHGGLLFRRKNKAHAAQARQHGIIPIDFVIVNLYPFEEVTRDPKVKPGVAIENIDIGGPSMLRSAAKNHESVTVICDPADYPEIVQTLEQKKGVIPLKLRQQLAAKVFARTSAYDGAIAQYLKSQSPVQKKEDGGPALPESLTVPYHKDRDLRYGENPHQRAALYVRSGGSPKLQYEQLHGKELSYNNLLDIEGTLDILREFGEPAACVIKHTNPCGAAIGGSCEQALEKAIECDAMSAFGGIIGINRPCDLKTAQLAFDRLRFFEVFVAPSFQPAALNFMKKRQNLRLIATGELGSGGPFDLRYLKSGILLQDRDASLRLREKELKKKLQFVTRVKLKDSEIGKLLFAFKCVKVVKSNAIVITQDYHTVGIGAGQMSRVDSVEIACRKAGYRTEGGILASDAFFPMPDSIEVAHEHKIKAIIQPGGSVRDNDVVAACDRLGIAMAMTGERHFRH